MIARWNNLSRASRVLLVGGAVLLLLAASGFLQADQGLAVSAEEAAAIAEGHVDFEPERVQVRLLRQGFGLRPVWAVSLSTPMANGSGFEELTVVEVDASTGNVLRIVNDS